eukprot:Gb_00403 [translate_table: standard]
MIAGKITSRCDAVTLLLAATQAIFLEIGGGAGTSTRIADLQLQWWREKLPDIQVPQEVQIRMSPLTQGEVQSLRKIMNESNLRLNATEFCSSANLQCDQYGNILSRLTFAYGSQNHRDEPEKHMFIDPKELKEGGVITLPDLHSPISWKAFLPRDVAEMIPFSSATLPQVLAMFHIDRNSNMSHNMMSTLKACESRLEEGEERQCSTSIEGMVEFVLGANRSHSLELVSHPSTVGSGKKARITKMVRREYVVSKPPVACHSLVFPYGVFYCHSFKGTNTIEMELQVLVNDQNNANKVINGTAVCHYFSNGMGKEAVCHLIYGSTLLWLPKRNA